MTQSTDIILPAAPDDTPGALIVHPRTYRLNPEAALTLSDLWEQIKDKLPESMEDRIAMVKEGLREYLFELRDSYLQEHQGMVDFLYVKENKTVEERVLLEHFDAIEDWESTLRGHLETDGDENIREGILEYLILFLYRLEGQFDEVCGPLSELKRTRLSSEVLLKLSLCQNDWREYLSSLMGSLLSEISDLETLLTRARAEKLFVLDLELNDGSDESACFEKHKEVARRLLSGEHIKSFPAVGKVHAENIITTCFKMFGDMLDAEGLLTELVKYISNSLAASFGALLDENGTAQPEEVEDIRGNKTFLAPFPWVAFEFLNDLFSSLLNLEKKTVSDFEDTTREDNIPGSLACFQWSFGAQGRVFVTGLNLDFIRQRLQGRLIEEGYLLEDPSSIPLYQEAKRLFQSHLTEEKVAFDKLPPDEQQAYLDRKGLAQSLRHDGFDDDGVTEFEKLTLSGQKHWMTHTTATQALFLNINSLSTPNPLSDGLVPPPGMESSLLESAARVSLHDFPEGSDWTWGELLILRREDEEALFCLGGIEDKEAFFPTIVKGRCSEALCYFYKRGWITWGSLQKYLLGKEEDMSCSHWVSILRSKTSFDFLRAVCEIVLKEKKGIQKLSILLKLPIEETGETYFSDVLSFDNVKAFQVIVNVFVSQGDVGVKELKNLLLLLPKKGDVPHLGHALLQDRPEEYVEVLCDALFDWDEEKGLKVWADMLSHYTEESRTNLGEVLYFQEHESFRTIAHSFLSKGEKGLSELRRVLLSPIEKDGVSHFSKMMEEDISPNFIEALCDEMFRHEPEKSLGALSELCRSPVLGAGRDTLCFVVSTHNLDVFKILVDIFLSQGDSGLHALKALLFSPVSKGKYPHLAQLILPETCYEFMEALCEGVLDKLGEQGLELLKEMLLHPAAEDGRTILSLVIQCNHSSVFEVITYAFLSQEEAGCSMLKEVLQTSINHEGITHFEAVLHPNTTDSKFPEALCEDGFLKAWPLEKILALFLTTSGHEEDSCFYVTQRCTQKIREAVFRASLRDIESLRSISEVGMSLLFRVGCYSGEMEPFLQLLIDINAGESSLLSQVDWVEDSVFVKTIANVLSSFASPKRRAWMHQITHHAGEKRKACLKALHDALWQKAEADENASLKRFFDTVSPSVWASPLPEMMRLQTLFERYQENFPASTPEVGIDAVIETICQYCEETFCLLPRASASADESSDDSHLQNEAAKKQYMNTIRTNVIKHLGEESAYPYQQSFLECFKVIRGVLGGHSIPGMRKIPDAVQTTLKRQVWASSTQNIERFHRVLIQVAQALAESPDHLDALIASLRAYHQESLRVRLHGLQDSQIHQVYQKTAGTILGEIAPSEETCDASKKLVPERALYLMQQSVDVFLSPERLIHHLLGQIKEQVMSACGLLTDKGDIERMRYSDDAFGSLKKSLSGILQLDDHSMDDLSGSGEREGVLQCFLIASSDDGPARVTGLDWDFIQERLEDLLVEKGYVMRRPSGPSMPTSLSDIYYTMHPDAFFTLPDDEQERIKEMLDSEKQESLWIRRSPLFVSEDRPLDEKMFDGFLSRAQAIMLRGTLFWLSSLNAIQDKHRMVETAIRGGGLKILSHMDEQGWIKLERLPSFLLEESVSGDEDSLNNVEAWGLSLLSTKEFGTTPQLFRAIFSYDAVSLRCILRVLSALEASGAEKAQQILGSKVELTGRTHFSYLFQSNVPASLMKTVCHALTQMEGGLDALSDLLCSPGDEGENTILLSVMYEANNTAFQSIVDAFVSQGESGVKALQALLFRTACGPGLTPDSKYFVCLLAIQRAHALFGTLCQALSNQGEQGFDVLNTLLCAEHPFFKISNFWWMISHDTESLDFFGAMLNAYLDRGEMGLHALEDIFVESPTQESRGHLTELSRTPALVNRMGKLCDAFLRAGYGDQLVYLLSLTASGEAYPHFHLIVTEGHTAILQAVLKAFLNTEEGRIHLKKLFRSTPHPTSVTFLGQLIQLGGDKMLDALYETVLKADKGSDLLLELLCEEAGPLIIGSGAVNSTGIAWLARHQNQELFKKFYECLRKHTQAWIKGKKNPWYQNLFKGIDPIHRSVFQKSWDNVEKNYKDPSSAQGGFFGKGENKKGSQGNQTTPKKGRKNKREPRR